MPLVSVVISCYNQEKYIADAIRSVKDQTYSDFECVIVNDGSIDNSENVISEEIADDKRFVLLSKNNEGICKTRNYGITNSHGKYILPLDGDDMIGNTYIEDAVKVLNSNPNIGVVYCKAEKFGKEKGLWHLPRFSMEMMLVNNCIFNCAMFRKSDFDKTSGYNENMSGGAEDWDFWLSILECNSKVYCIDKVLFFYRIKQVSRNAALMDLELKKELFEVMWSNHKGLYSKYCPNPVNSAVFNSVITSPEYKIGQLICKPLRYIKRLLKI